MTIAWIAPFLFLAVTGGFGNREITESVDMIELNHFHDCLGRHVYDQVIFYEWAPDVERYHVRAWCLVEDREMMSRRPVHRYESDQVIVKWQDREQNLMRVISSSNYRETWTQVDPERSNKKLLDERLRMHLVRRLPLKVFADAEVEDATDTLVESDVRVQASQLANSSAIPANGAIATVTRTRENSAVVPVPEPIVIAAVAELVPEVAAEIQNSPTADTPVHPVDTALDVVTPSNSVGEISTDAVTLVAAGAQHATVAQSAK